ncbi:phosphatase PAP2 family protein [Polyangium aurulentum]|uniref:phosphatase PAP2 family protein n=1 Tax=Polyangium aurulentum TaxID=2567896 RepID=UPI0010AE7F89|nr:phosphatase PAP2 family protein [Polyangium aurulentum]UQA55410.1 phosphatase PAP2 family protein [Polyangium aurulentum]
MKRARRLGLAGAIFALSALAAPEARAADGPKAPGWAFGSVGGEIGLAAASAAVPAFYFLPQRRSRWGPFAAHTHHVDAELISNIVGGPGGILFASALGYGWEYAYLRSSSVEGAPLLAMRASVIDLESVLLSTGLVQLVKRMSGRCRPWAWAGSVKGCVSPRDDDHASFPSGHTAPVASIAGARLLIALRSDGAGPIGYRYAAFGFAEVLSIGAAFARVGAGAHSWEDVSVGWLLGHATGALVALAHPMVDAPVIESSRQAGGALSGAPLFFSWGGQF